MSVILAAVAALALTVAADDLSRPATALTAPSGWVTADDYPPGAIRDRAEGTAELLFRVLASGRIGVCDIGRSTGSDLLDAMSCALVKARGRYRPELDARGRAVESATKTLRFTWKMPEPDATDMAERDFGIPFQLRIIVDADADGRIEDCHVAVRTGPVPVPSGDPCLVIREHQTAPMTDPGGAAAPARLVYSMSLTRQAR